MHHSCQAPSYFTCRSCNRRVDVNAWILIDVDERPDLVEKLRNNDLTTLDCPSCQEPLIADLPVLLYFRGEVSPLLFSPAISTREEQNRRHAAMTQQLARQQLTDVWQEDWIVDGLVAIPREKLMEMLQGTAESLREGLQDSAITAWLMQLISKDAVSECRDLLSRHPDLLQLAAEEKLREWGEESIRQGDLETDALLREYRTMISRSRQLGIQAAFEERGRAHNPDRTPQVESLLSQFYRLLEQNESMSEQVGRDRINVCRQLIKDLDADKDEYNLAVAEGYLGRFLLEHGSPTLTTWNEAIELIRNALSRPQLQVSPESVALVATFFAGAILSRPEGIELIEDGRTSLVNAVKQLNPDLHVELWSKCHQFIAYLCAGGNTLPTSTNAEAGIGHLEQALAVDGMDDEVRAGLQLSLAQAYARRQVGDVADNLERARQHGELAAEYFTRDHRPHHWGRAQVYLANIYFRRVRGEKATNIETAIQKCEQVIDQLPLAEYPQLHATCHNNLGNFYSQRVGNRRDIGVAIDHYREALRYCDAREHPDKWGLLQHNLGYAFLKNPNGFGFDDIEPAIGYLSRALTVRTVERSPVEWANTNLNLATAYAQRQQGDPQENFEAALKHAQAAESVFLRTAYPFRWAELQMVQASIWLSRKGRVGELVIRDSASSPEDLRQAIHHTQQAVLEHTRDRTPATHRDAQIQLGELFVRQGDLASAQASYLNAIDVGANLFDAAFSTVGRLNELTATSSLFGKAAACALLAGHAEEAVVLVEQGKARLLAETLSLAHLAAEQVGDEVRQRLARLRTEILALEAKQANSQEPENRQAWLELGSSLEALRCQLREVLEDVRQQSPELLSGPLEFADIADLAPEKGALLVPLVSSLGAFVFILTSGLRELKGEHFVDLGEAGSQAIEKILEGSVAAGISLRSGDGRPLAGWLAPRTENWIETVTSTSREIWAAIMKPIANRLKVLGLASNAEIVILPHRGLGVLPLHAASGEDGRPLIDDFVISYAPGARALESSLRRTKTQDPGHSLLAVVDPTMDLDWSQIEGHALYSMFPESDRRMLLQEQAQIGRVCQAAPEFTHLHFCCHGSFCWDNIALSGLLLADGTLTLSQVIQHLDLKACRLVTLSACDTGQTEMWRLPDEFLGLPAAFLQAGATCVVATLWRVNDVSAMLMMEEFYRRHLGGESPAVALQGAQQWLRTVTAGELTERFQRARVQSEQQQSFAAADASRMWRRFVSRPSSDVPFHEPYYWAPYCAYGA